MLNFMLRVYTSLDVLELGCMWFLQSCNLLEWLSAAGQWQALYAFEPSDGDSMLASLQQLCKQHQLQRGW